MRGDDAPEREICGAGAAPWQLALEEGDACRRQQKLALPGRPPLVPAAGGTRSPRTGDRQQRHPGKTLWSCSPGWGQRLSPLLTPSTSSCAHPGPEALRYRGAELELARPGHVATNT